MFLRPTPTDSTLAAKPSVENFMPLVCLLPSPFLSVVSQLGQDELAL